jgi:PAS domain S-box-containing protein
MRRLPIHLAWLAVLVCSAPSFASGDAASASSRTVLAIFAQDRGTPAMSALDESLQQALRAVPGDGVTYYSEYLDSFRFSGDRYLQVMRDYLRRRYDGRRIDVVITIGGRAAEAIMDPEAPLFSGVPMIFYDADRSGLELRGRGVVVTGLLGHDHRRTLEMALALHPGTEQVFVVVQTRFGNVTYGTNVRAQLAGITGVRIEYLDMGTRELLAKLSQVPKRSLILYVRQDEDLSGERAYPRDVLPLLASSVSVPIYGGFDFFLGYGIVGGYLFSSEANGAALAGLAVRLADGEWFENVSAEVPAAEAMFDARQLRRWGIAEDSLPAGSRILFRDPTFWVRYRRYAIGGLSIMLIQLALIGTLLLQRSRRRRAEGSLTESEQRYRYVVEAQTDFVCRYRPDSTLTFVNEAYCRFMGRSARELLGLKILDLVPPSARLSLECHFAWLVESPGATGRFEHPMRWPDGRTGWLEWINHSQPGPDGRVIELLGTGRDISDRKRAADALRDSEARNSAILRALPDLMFRMNRDGVYLGYHAKNVEDLFVPPDQFIGKKMLDVMPPELSSRFAEALADATESGGPSIVEYSLPMPNGLRSFEARLVACGEDQVLSIVREVTEQRRAQAQLGDSEHRYALATAAGGVGVWDWTIETDRLYVDPVVLGILGHAPADATHRRVDWRDLAHPQDQEIIRSSAYACVQGRSQKMDIEHRMIHRDGSIRWFHTRGSAVRHDDGTVYRLVGTFTDVSERKRAEHALRESEAALRASYQEIRDLAGRLIAAQETERKRIARELHDDLSQKVALVGLEIDQLDPDAPDFAARIGRLARRAGEVATDVHDLSHRLHPFKLEMLGLTAAVGGICRDVAAQHGLAVEFRHDHVPERLAPDLALCLYRIVQEGLHNVVKHSGARNAWLNLERVNGDLALQIADSGSGFEPEACERTGLGLVSMRERVHFLGGQLAIHSTPGEGTRIGVRVPIASKEANV